MRLNRSWLFLVLLLCAEYFFFYRFVMIEVAPNYPSGIDQANYLSASYFLFTQVRSHGWWFALTHYDLYPTTALFVIQAAAFFTLFNASRLAALSLNFIYFAVLQLVGFYTIKKHTQSYSLGFLFVGSLLATQTFFHFGGALDFRVDFMALCLYGMFVCTVLNSGVFLQRKGACVSGVVAALLILMRFLTATYIAGITLSAFVYFGFKQDRARLKNLFYFMLVIAIFTLPALWVHRHLLYSYYVVGHAVGSEKLFRAAMVGVRGQFANLIYYPVTFVSLHLQLSFFLMLSLVTFMLAALARLSRGRAPFSQRKIYHDEILFLSLSIVVPLIILTLDWSKSSIVPGIVLVPFLLLLVWVYCSLYEKIAIVMPQQPLLLGRYLAILFLLLGMKNFIFSSYHVNAATYSQDSRAINQLLVQIGDKLHAANIDNVYATADTYTDFLAALPAYYFERRGVILKFTCAFGCGSQTWVESKDSALKEVMQSSLFMSRLNPDAPNKFYRFDQCIAAFRPALKEVAVRKMNHSAGYAINNVEYEIYWGVKR